MKKDEFLVEGMMCANCKATVEKALKGLPGMKEASVNLATKKSVVTYDESKLDLEKIKAAVVEEGYEVFFIEQKDDYLKEVEQKAQISKKKLWFSLVFAVLEFYASMGPMIGLPFFFVNSNHVAYIIVQLCLTIPVIVVNYQLFYKGYRNLIRFKPSMESLVAVGTTASFAYSIYSFILVLNGSMDAMHNLYFESVAVILFLIQLGKYFEVKSLTRANSAIKDLMNKAPSKCFVLENNKEVEKNISDVKVGDILVAKPGDVIAVDGQITDGYSSLDESMLSGESLPVEKTLSNQVFAGTINLSARIEYQAIGIGEQTMLSKIIKMVEDAQASKAPIERMADKVAGIFTKVVISLALIAFGIWMIITKADWDFSLRIFASMLVIACPCALGLATPTAIIVGTGVGARNGILYKDAQSLELFSKIDTIYFDKTGTLTKGRFVVSNIETTIDENGFIQMVASFENASNHPLAKAIVEYAKEKKITIDSKVECQEIPGVGLIGKSAGKQVQIGKNDILKTNIFNEAIDTYSKQGKSIICVSTDTEDLGIFALMDMVKEDAQKTITELKQMGIKTAMITGDNQASADFVAKNLGIDIVHANVLPIDKAEYVKKAKVNSKVCFVGDGINDSVALTAADIGISFTNGTDIAVESSDIIITSGNLNDVVTATKLSHKIMRHIKQNLFFAFFYNSIGLSVAAGVFYSLWGWLLNPMIGALAMSLSSLSVVSNALRINLFKKEK